MVHHRLRCSLLLGCVFIVASIANVTRPDDIPVVDMQPTVAELLDPNWIEYSLHEVGIDRLIKFYDDFDDPLTERVQQALILSHWFLKEHPEELRSQLQARLLSSDEPELQVFQEFPSEGIHVRAMRASLNQAGDGLVGAYPLSRQGGDFVVAPDGSVMAAHSLRRDLPNERGSILGISIHNSLTGEVIATIAEGGVYKFPLAISPSRRTVVGADNNGFAHAWDISSGEELWEDRIAMERPRNVSAAFSSDASMVAILSNEKRAIYDAATGVQISTLTLDDEAIVHEVAFLDNQHLAGCVDKHGIVVWDVATGAVSYELAVEATRLSNDGRMAIVPDVSLEENRVVLHAIDVISTETGELLRKFVIDERMVVRDYDFDPEGAHVVVLTYRGECPIVAFGIESGEVDARIHQGHSHGLHMRPISGLRVLTSSLDDRIHVWDLNNTADRRVADEPARIRCLDMTGDGRIAVTTETRLGHMHLWDLETGRITAVFQIPVAPGFIQGVTISDDGGTILAHSSSTVFDVDPVTGQVTTLLEWPLGRDVNLWTLQISGDGSTAIVTSRERMIVFDPTNANILQRMDGAISADISRDGGILLVGNMFYNRNTGDQRAIEGMVGAHISLSDDGSRAIDYWTFRGGVLWNLATFSPLDGGSVVWKEDLPAGAGVGSETDSDLSADGRYTVSRDLDGQLVVTDTQLQKRIATLTLDDNVFLDVVMSDDGSTILVTTQMGRLHQFRIENLPSTGAVE